MTITKVSRHDVFNVLMFLIYVSISAFIAIYAATKFSKHYAEMDAKWMEKCVTTVAGAQGIILQTDTNSAVVAFSSGSKESYNYESLAPRECEVS